MRRFAPWLLSVWTLVPGLLAAPPAYQPQLPATAAALAADELDAETGEECTIGVACGRATADGRPLMWKNRDAQKRDNVVTAFDDGKVPYLGLCDAGSKSTVWGGANAAGFCILNSVSRDLPQGSTKGPGNGSFMKLALQRCTLVADFERLLEDTNDNGRRTRANFAVIDAQGGAAIFETSHKTFRRFDAKDAADGLVLRTNFAMTGKGDRGRDRLARAQSICKARPKGTLLDPAFVLDRICRDLEAPASAEHGADGQLDVRETIHRQTTVAAMVFHGCKENEDPRFTTMWSVLGQPLFSIAVPCWPGAGSPAPAIAGTPRSALCDAAIQLQDAFYVHPAPKSDPADAASGTDGTNGNATEAEVAGSNRWLLLADLPGVRKQLQPVEQAIFAATKEQLAQWRAAKEAPSADAVREFHTRQANAAAKAVKAAAGQRTPAEIGR